MPFCDLPDLRVHYLDDGPKDGPAVVFANSLGTSTVMWDHMVPHLPDGLRLIRYDKRGHGLTDVPPPPYAMGALVRDAEALIDHLGLTRVVFVGLSIGGLIAQGLAAKRPDLVKALVLSNTGAKIGTREIWEDRIQTTRKLGMAQVAPQILKRWFNHKMPDPLVMQDCVDHLTTMTTDGYTGCAAAIQGTDFITPTSGLQVPALGIAGGRDVATPADMVREVCDLIHGSTFKVIPNAGHIPPLDHPERYAAILTEFLADVAHLPK